MPSHTGVSGGWYQGEKESLGIPWRGLKEKDQPRGGGFGLLGLSKAAVVRLLGESLLPVPPLDLAYLTFTCALGQVAFSLLQSVSHTAASSQAKAPPGLEGREVGIAAGLGAGCPGGPGSQAAVLGPCHVEGGREANHVGRVAGAAFPSIPPPSGKRTERGRARSSPGVAGTGAVVVGVSSATQNTKQREVNRFPSSSSSSLSCLLQSKLRSKHFPAVVIVRSVFSFDRSHRLQF